MANVQKRIPISSSSTALSLNIKSIDNNLSTLQHIFTAETFERFQDPVMEDLQKLGLSAKEAKILLYLMVRKSSTAAEISRNVGVARTETYHYLASLLSKGVALTTFDRPQRYYALQYKEAVDMLVQAKHEALKAVCENREKHDEVINRIVEGMVVPSHEYSESYQVVMGEDSVNMRVKKMIEEAREDVTMLLSDRNLVRLYHAGVIDALAALNGVQIRIQTSCKNANEYLQHCRKGLKNNGGEPMARSVSEVQSNFVMVDRKKIMILDEDKTSRQRTYGFYTNNRALVDAFLFIFKKSAE